MTITLPVWGSASETKIAWLRFSAGALSRVRSSSSSAQSGRMMVRQRTGQTSMQASHSMQSGAWKAVWMSQLRQRCTSRAVSSGPKPSSTSRLRRSKRRLRSTRAISCRPWGL